MCNLFKLVTATVIPHFDDPSAFDEEEFQTLDSDIDLPDSDSDAESELSDCSDVDEVDECEIEEVDLANMPPLVCTGLLESTPRGKEPLVTSNDDAFFAGLC